MVVGEARGAKPARHTTTSEHSLSQVTLNPLLELNEPLRRCRRRHWHRRKCVGRRQCHRRGCVGVGRSDVGASPRVSAKSGSVALFARNRAKLAPLTTLNTSRSGIGASPTRSRPTRWGEWEGRGSRPREANVFFGLRSLSYTTRSHSHTLIASTPQHPHSRLLLYLKTLNSLAHLTVRIWLCGRHPNAAAAASAAARPPFELTAATLVFSGPSTVRWKGEPSTCCRPNVTAIWHTPDTAATYVTR